MSSEKNPHLHQLFTVKFSGYDVIRWIFGATNKGKLICNSLNDIISVNYDSKEVDQDEISHYEDILHFF